MSALKILGLAGSARTGSYNRKLLALIIDRLRRQGIDAEVFEFRDTPLPMFDQDEEAASGLPENAKLLKSKILEADAVVLVAPEYNSSVTPLLKNAIDWASRQDPTTGVGNVWRHKVIALASASPGAYGGMRGLIALRPVFQHLDSLVIAEQVSVPKAHEAFEGEGLKDERTSQFLDAMLSRLVEVATIHQRATVGSS
ncbi:MAG: NAD(P)H-dependent oxidoreductase [Fimbriimonadaceae bacterium]|nr:NAD(P)H-dependent oxidoreductase [Fimbriimonadaceae bacterium]QYK57655.1 MAG: NAD(P)H-dependent oxidoreductase [Fimbriimonadaceae bacterium]